MLSELINSQLIQLDLKATNLESLFQEVGSNLYEKSYVENTYIPALKKREDSFPTGLKTQFLNICLPHSDVEHIKKPFVYICKTNQLISVRQMGDNSEMESKYFFFLGIKNPKKQVGLLSEIITLFQNESFVENFKNTSSNVELLDLINQYLKEK
ncbi:PTS sugar transporter subunit IIA [Streptococcus dysgalactiae subsp. equisimilis]|uniref:PTS sugar transporter subunit IIA n=1 Tax=Streptococcus dysgalactiae TaxID=1334 RepID=UPI0010CAB4EF|nr:PTS sugar transporter subunit IIA [Streptococcus dysgalactiae]VTS24787.1 phosphoenolpyruvate-dependent sugar phosphotransferase system [Streptococcus dysgalactiae subsp. equisimilis]